ncbi:MAG: 1-(5-phosphoribosyl)-5-[(5-phosphoribosylamino)methylideneamino]imidazole-4-carboxamide isomerase [Bacteroidales bacterium]
MIEIIPAIDIIDGHCVRLSKGDYEQKKVYSASPVEVAKGFEDAGCKRLHLVDLDGAKSNHIVNYKVLEEIATKTNLVIDFGGGIKSDEDANVAFNSGAKMITGGSIAVKNPEVFENWITKYGSEKIILGADAKDGMIATVGWLEESDKEIIPFIKSYVSKGVIRVISTDIECDGMLQGPSIELYRKMLVEIPEIELIASGGVSSVADVVALNDINVPAVIVGKAIYEGRITMKELERLNTGR